MQRNTTPAVEAITNMGHAGNIVNPLWVHWIKAQVPGANSAASTAVLVLSDIIYWYRASIIRDETTGAILEVRKRFKADKLQRGYEAIAEQWGITKRQAQRACYLLRDAGLITIELRTVISQGMKIPNVVFLEPVPENIARASQGPEQEPRSSQKGQEVEPKEVRGRTKKGKTPSQKRCDKYIDYTENTHQTTTTTEAGGSGGEGEGGVSLEDQREADEVASHIVGHQYIGNDGLTYHYRKTRPLVNACFGHNQQSAENAMLASWEFMENERQQGRRIRNAQGVLIRALRDWQEPTAEYEAMIRGTKAG